MVEGTPLLPSATEPLSVLLMNTIWADRAAVHDAFATRDEFAAWLAVLAPRLPDGAVVRQVTQADLKAFRATRGAARRLAADRTADPRPRATEPSTPAQLAEAVGIINAAVAAAPPTPSLLWPDATCAIVAPPSVRAAVAALAVLAADTIEVIAGAKQGPLRACLAAGCVLYFVKDHPRRE